MAARIRAEDLPPELQEQLGLNNLGKSAKEAEEKEAIMEAVSPFVSRINQLRNKEVVATDRAHRAAERAARAAKNITKAVTKAAMKKAKTELKIAEMERRAQEAAARTALAEAKTEEAYAKAAAVDAHTVLWASRWQRAGTILSPGISAAKATGRAAGRGAVIGLDFLSNAMGFRGTAQRRNRPSRSRRSSSSSIALRSMR